MAREHLRIERLIEPNISKEKLIHIPRKFKPQRSIRKSEKKNKEYWVQDWIPVKKIQYGMVLTTDNRYVKIVEIEPVNLNQLSPEYQKRIFQRFFSWIKISPSNLQFKVRTEKCDVGVLVENALECSKGETDQGFINRRDDYIKMVKNLGENETATKRFFIIYQYEGDYYTGKYATDEYEIAQQLNDIVEVMSSYFNGMGNSVIDYTNEQLEEVLFKHFNRRSSLYETVKMRKERLQFDQRLLAGINEADYDEKDISLTSIIGPRGLNLKHADYIIMDGVYYTYLYIASDSYPINVDGTWSGLLTDYGEGVDVDMYHKKVPRESMIAALDRNLRLAKIDAKRLQGSDLSEKTDRISFGNFILSRLRTMEDMYYTCCLFTIWDYDLAALRKRAGRVRKTLEAQNIYAHETYAFCENAARMAIPLLAMDKVIFSRAKHNFLTSSIASCYWYRENRTYDNSGFVIGTSIDMRTIATFNNFNTAKHKNANIGIAGTSGAGKTFLEMVLSYRFRMSGVGTIMIIPEKGHEWRKLCKEIDGEYIDLFPGSQYCINIMEIRARAKIDESLLDGDFVEVNYLQEKIEEIESLVDMVLTQQLTDLQITNLEIAILQTYEHFGMNERNDSIFDEDGSIKAMPIISDLIRETRKFENLETVSTVLTSIFETGMCKNMNGQTNFDLDNKYIVIDITNAVNKYKDMFSYIASMAALRKCKDSLNERYMVIIDELWRLMQSSKAADIIVRLLKLLRGYAAGCAYATQQLNDLDKLENGRYSEAIIDNSAIKLLLQMGEKEAPVVEKLFNLSKDEVESLQEQQTGTALYISRGSKVPIRIKATDEEFYLFNTDHNKRRPA